MRSVAIVVRQEWRGGVICSCAPNSTSPGIGLACTRPRYFRPASVLPVLASELDREKGRK